MGNKWWWCIVWASLLCAGCASLMEKAGRTLDGSGRAEKKIAEYRSPALTLQQMRSKTGEDSLLITAEHFPALKIRANAPNEQGDFTITALDYLGSSPHGWNEYRIELSGTGNLVLGETTATLSIADEIETVGITDGRIRRYDTRISGTEALTNLRNRRERLLSLAEWINDPENPHAQECGSQKEFERYWKPILFPEVTKKNMRPEGWQQEGDRQVRAEDIRWNAGYTERIFPEALRPIRDSGTMLRDWEEAIDWIYIECEWNRITETLLGETVLHKK
ncbi:MAG: hypothetical protein FWF55_07755 [Treponema sp.]|nr:hypothetical protein [Treponema sp.]